MRKDTARKRKGADKITAGSGNVFADVRVRDPEEQQTKVKIAFALNQILDRQRGTQQEIADKLQTDQPKISALKRYKLDGLSVERLMGFLTALDYDIDIKIMRKRSKQDRRSGRIKVKVAA